MNGLADNMNAAKDFNDPAVQWWLNTLDGSVDAWELEALDDATYAADAFSRDLTFGTGGIRGLMGVGPNRLNDLTVGRASQGLANYLNAGAGVRHRAPKVVVAYDTRIHSRQFAELTAEVLLANGIVVRLFEQPVPTPVLSFAVRELKCDAGVVLTASHNPKEYNGYKVYGPTGDQATDALAHAVQGQIEQLDPFADVKRGSLDDAGFAWVGEEVIDKYVDAVLQQSAGVDCSDLKVVYSPLNGTGLVPAKKLAERAGIALSLVEEQAQPDGTFPTCPRPNPELPKAMEMGERQMLDKGADVFLASDPDADRIGVACAVNGEARLLSGNEVGLLLLDFLARRAPRPQSGKLAVAVTTIVSSPLADAIARANNIELRRTLTGFKYVGEQIDLLERCGEGDRFMLGFEESCGYLRGTYVRDKDSMVAFLLVCEMAAAYKAEGKTLVDALDDLYARYGQMLGKQLTLELPGQAGRAAIARAMRDLRESRPKSIGGLAVERAIDYSQGAPMPIVGGATRQVLPAADVLEYRLAGGSRVIVRPSGTEPKLKTYCFAAGPNEGSARDTLEGIRMDVQNFLDRYSGNDDGAKPIHVVLLSGGSGTRLWPLSNSARSKQFLKVLRDAKGDHVSMVQRVFSQIERVDANIDITIATSAAQAEELGLQIPKEKYTLVAEPERRDTAPAIMLACASLALQQGAGLDDTVIVMPIDTYADQGYYDRIPRIAATIEAGQSDLVLLGVKPTYPSEKYGYIIPAGTEGDVWPVREFREKPDEATAKQYITVGGLWNCGVFGFRLGYLRDITNGYYDAASYEDLLKHYRSLPKNSFDYEVVEKAQSISVVPYEGTWKDLGTWNTLTEEMAEPYAGDVYPDDGSVSNVHVVNETHVPIVVAGISNAVVVATPDGILVSGKEESAHIKALVSEASKEKPMQETRAWGAYQVLDDPASQETPGGVRELTVHAGETTPEATNPQMRCCVVTAGRGSFKVGESTVEVGPGSTVTVPAGVLRSITANTDLSLVETVISPEVSR